MSDEPKNLTAKWRALVPGMLSIAMLAAYQGVHYSTVALVWEPGACCPSCGHAIGGQDVPDLAECLFFPAQIIDTLIGFDPYRRITPHVRTDWWTPHRPPFPLL